MEHATGDILDGRYEIRSCLASSKAGVFYLAADREREGKVVTLRQLAAPEEDVSKEVALLAALDHPGIPKALGQFQASGCHYVVMEAYQGTSLESLVSQEGPLPQERVVRCALGLCLVLEYLHSQTAPIVHRDLQPSSVLYNSQDELLICDFGLARIVASAEKKTMIGTLGYSPREQARGYPEPRSDLYAVGAIMHYCLSGRVPKPFAILPMAQACPGVLAEVAAIVDRAVRPDPFDRFPSAREMRAALEQALRKLTGQAEDAPDDGVASTPAALELPAQPAPSLWPWVALVSAGVLALVAYLSWG